MFPPPQFPGQGLSSPGAPRVPPGPPGNHPLNQPTSCSSTRPPQPPSGAPERHPIHLPTKSFQPPAKTWITAFVGNARQQATGDGSGRVRRQKGVNLPPRVAKYNIHGYDSLGVEWQAYGSSPQTTPSLIYRCEALGGIGRFHRQKRQPERAIHSHINVQVHLGAG